MSAVEVIAAALAAGAGAGMKDTASAAVKDAYAGLKALLKARLGGHGDDVVEALDADETAPGVWQTHLGEALTESGAATDEQVVAAAQRLLRLTDPAGSAAGKYQVDLREAKGVQVGDHNTQHNTFS
ncbi:hypothetical protein ACFQS1_39165 [Paractinoplanes rhizophilus]|uniref:RHIM domain-containing protein n=1 Tax=Paractinoplanes rhizophilus TaxID=1416877 RepID=A0ABW2I539_9ACTN